MSWDQGVQMREDMPIQWVRLLDSKSPDPDWQMECISWHESVKDRLAAHYYHKETKMFQCVKEFRVVQREPQD